MDGPAGHGGPPPTPWERDVDGDRRRDRRAIVWSSVAAVLLGLPALLLAGGFLVAVLGADSGDDRPATAPADRDDDLPSAPPADVEVPELDLDELEGVDAEYGRLLTAIDASERTMLSAQQGFADAFLDAGSDGDLDQLLEDLSDAAGDGQRQLQQLRSDIAQPRQDEDVTELRDRYLTHLDAWVRYLVAVEREPELLLSEDGESVHHLAIDTSGDRFASLLRDGLPDDLDDDVAALARAIAERGFPERDAADPDTV